MMPARPPPPTASKRPFHALPSGSQTSNLIAGVTTPDTRQIAGIFSDCVEPGGPNPPGTLSSPAGTASADVIVVSGSFRFFKSAHAVAAFAAVVPTRAVALHTAAASAWMRSVMCVFLRVGGLGDLAPPIR